MLPLAPPLFSITTGWPSSLPSGSAVRRAEVSTTPPGGLGTTRVTGRPGCSCATAGEAARAASRAATARRAARREGAGWQGRMSVSGWRRVAAPAHPTDDAAPSRRARPSGLHRCARDKLTRPHRALDVTPCGPRPCRPIMPMPPFDPQRFDLASLRLFVHVLETGSLTGGAVRMGVSVAAASRRIADLEALVGVPLLARGARGVSPTAAGLTLQRHAVELVAGVEQLALPMADYHRGVQGHLRLWANPSAFNGFLPRLLADYAQACPAVKIDLEDALSEDAVRAVAGGVAELAVIGEGTPAPGRETHVCHVDELVLVAPRPHPLDAGDAADADAPVPLAEALRFDMVAL